MGYVYIYIYMLNRQDKALWLATRSSELSKRAAILSGGLPFGRLFTANASKTENLAQPTDEKWCCRESAPRREALKHTASHFQRRGLARTSRPGLMVTFGCLATLHIASNPEILRRSSAAHASTRLAGLSVRDPGPKKQRAAPWKRVSRLILLRDL